MKKCLPLLGAALGFALLITGCESDNSSSRIQEKSAVYATLKPWQKKNIDKGIVAMGFSPDMVYMAVGNPTTKTPDVTTEVWTYKTYYPSVGADQVKYTLNTDQSSAYSGNLNRGMPGSNAKTGPNAGKGNTSISQTGGMQGGSMEPADMVSYTLWVTFENGVVTKLKLEPNP